MSADVWLNKHVHALPVPDPWKNEFMPEQTVVPRLHDIGTSFHITTVECKSHPGTVAGVNLHRYDSFRCEPQEATGVNSYQNVEIYKWKRRGEELPANICNI